MAKQIINLKLLTLSTLFIVFSSSCLESDNIKPDSSGKVGNIVLVLSELVYNSTIVDSIVTMMNTEVEGLPQFESQFDLIIIKESEFSHLFQMHRNIITVHVDKDLQSEEPELAVKKDVWSEPQLVARLRAKDTIALKKVIMSYTEPLCETFNKAERNRIITDYSTIVQQESQSQLKENFNISSAIPRTFHPVVREEDFLWLRRQEREYELGLMIYKKPYTDRNEFSTDYIIKFRDSISQRNIPGPSEGSFMTTEKRLPFFSDTVSINNKFGILTRGLWRTEGDFMGGPFINYTFYNESIGQLISIDGYVYAPKYAKREKVRQLEAIIYSLKY